VLARAQVELDAVVGAGPGRLPMLADRENLPYVDAIVKETLRWRTVVPLGLPHTPMEDDTYGGYCIPKGVTILANIWKFCHDPNIYHDPMAFKPERFLGNAPEQDPRAISFGFGRRVCPGRELADVSMFLAIAKSLAAFNISKAKDAAGNVIEPSLAYDPGLLNHPREFKYSIRPRSAKAIALVNAINDEHPWGHNDAETLKNVKWPIKTS